MYMLDVSSIYVLMKMKEILHKQRVSIADSYGLINGFINVSVY